MQTLNCHGKLIDLSVPKVMGIINVTPDSFYDGGKTFTEKEILKQAEKMLSEGATFLDIGGYSTRPGADEISESEETRRVVEAIEIILKIFSEALISVDSFRSKVAKKAVEAGAAMVNDVSGGTLDAEMYKTVAKLKVPYILMHMRGTPKTMAKLNDYMNVTIEVLKNLSEKIALARAEGIDDIIVDPGFGFAKTREQSFQILNNLELFQNLDIPVLVGVSRKSMIYTTLEISSEDALNGTTALNTISLLKGASILRVHDVKEAVECVKLFESLKNITK
ncbi:dihydropteroate synthase [Aequorivita lipolytica]|uniref:Dihydropteroate synthase n=1 Tax=Aequorivita lipolytica TaxID=153267 RepID=A0A5C6YMP4_9FLAO|nr:dihydropteroate synthase [Aequorivita lipolytica]TXD68676.1 dihydropteroate synthase [Aequorivita lipolytica]SRX53183.1 Dihydropteroate synthase [Aequorivita lipolytica]